MKCKSEMKGFGMCKTSTNMLMNNKYEYWTWILENNIFYCHWDVCRVSNGQVMHQACIALLKEQHWTSACSTNWVTKTTPVTSLDQAITVNCVSHKYCGEDAVNTTTLITFFV